MTPFGNPEGIPPSFAETYRTHLPRLRRALELTGLDSSTAEDLAQEAFARTLYHWARIAKGSNPAGYAYRVGFNLAKRHWRSLSRHGTLQTPSEAERPSRPDSIDEQVTTRMLAEEALSRMPPRQRACALLCLFAGVSTKDAARALGITQGTVRTHLAHARATLAVALRSEPPAPDASHHQRGQPNDEVPGKEVPDTSRDVSGTGSVAHVIRLEET